MTNETKLFSSALSQAPKWRENAEELASLVAGTGGKLGILYTGETFAEKLSAMTVFLKERTEVEDWVAASGYGVIGNDAEYFGEAGAAALILNLDVNAYRLFAGDSSVGSTLVSEHSAWVAEASMPLALTHVDPRHPEAAGAVRSFANSGGFLIGGLTAASGETPHLANGTSGCISGVAFSPTSIEIATGLSQGCTPLSKPHEITQCQNNILIELDGQPALDLFKQDIGAELSEDLQSCSGLIFAALPVPGSDTADYTVRNLVGIDADQKLIAIAASLEPGDQILFCRRDRENAVRDMRRMTLDLKRRIENKPIRGGIYISCAARGPNQFQQPERETDIIREILGDFPMIGFFANGEISRDRIYAYTGVLTLFL
ncbi:MAG: histidine kinase [Rhodospirillaceae bacterium]|nr:histidine kinase [Rhodospirillaceae bacterium]